MYGHYNMEDLTDGELAGEFADRMGIDNYELQKFLSNKTLADTIKLDSFILNQQKFTIEQFENFIKQIGK